MCHGDTHQGPQGTAQGTGVQGVGVGYWGAGLEGADWRV